MVFEIALTVTATDFSISQGNGKSFVLNKPLLLKLGSLYFSANNALKCYLCLSTGYICADYSLKKAT